MINERGSINKVEGTGYASIPVCKFDLIMDDGGVLKDCTLRCKKGIIRDLRDLNNAFRWEKEIKLFNSHFNGLSVNYGEVYNVQVVDTLIN